jgi:putative SOS response-associated peptidase YedK
MCGRMTLTRSGSEIADYFSEAMQALVSQGEGLPGASAVEEMNGRPLRPRFNLAPSQDVLTVVEAPLGSEFAAEFAWKRWGLIPSWAKDLSVGSRLFNARSETVDVKPSFRAAFKRRRCLVVADGFYEWTPRNRDHQCTVLTTEANQDLEGVHHRMPVILGAVDYSTWLDREAERDVLMKLTRPRPAGFLDRRAVGRQVNNPRIDDASCLTSESDANQSEITGGQQGELFASGSGAPKPRLRKSAKGVVSDDDGF